MKFDASVVYDSVDKDTSTIRVTVHVTDYTLKYNLGLSVHLGAYAKVLHPMIIKIDPELLADHFIRELEYTNYTVRKKDRRRIIEALNEVLPETIAVTAR